MEMLENKIFTVTEISSIIKELMEGAFENVRVQGEISNLKIAASGHIYFDLKDENSIIPAVIFKNYAGLIDAKLQNGLLVTVSGRISVYIKQGRYQIIVSSVTSHKRGDLYLQFEKLKAELEKKGYFDENRKKTIPTYPRRIGVVTSLEGAAFKDIIAVLKQRHPNLEIILAHASVQGERAKEEISQAIRDFNKLTPKVDVILVGRGGGSLEDLWAFNEREVAKAIFHSKIPIISCVGHETDFTIADFVADMRAPTPSAAAQFIVKSRREIMDSLVISEKRLIKSIEMFYHRLKFRVEKLSIFPVFKNPDILWQTRYQTLDQLNEDMIDCLEDKLTKISQETRLLGEKLKNLNPTAVLKRGYSIVRHKERVINSSSVVKEKDIVDIELYKGSLTGKIISKTS